MKGKDKPRIGIMGGTFDPIHIGHLILGETAYEQFHLDKVLFMPAGNPPHKKNRKGRATDEERVEMVRRAIDGNDHFELSLIEMNEDGYTYTYRTLERMRQEQEKADYFFIIGADSLYNFDTWKEPERICKAAKIVVATRDHTEDESLDYEMQRLSVKYGGEFLKLDSLNIDISSQMLRAWIEEKRTIKYYVPDCVIDFIQENQIYQ
ncbi:MAG: nicotinate-nucleotide adenylyltransferase [Ruminococcus sp.]